MYNDTAAREGFGAALTAASHLQNQSEELRDQPRALIIIITALATLFVGLRFLGRYKHGMYIGADDWTCLLALVLLYVNFVVHLVLFAGELLYVTSINTYKISLLFFYWRTFPVRLMKIGGLVLGLFSVLWTFTAVFVIVFQCIPISKAWKPWAEGVCTDLLHTEPAMASMNIVCDIAILCLPLQPVLSLKINSAQKAFVIGTFLLGSYVCFTSCYRLAMFFKFDPNDPTYTLAEAQAWDVVEMASGIISACLPTLGPILKTVTNSLLTNARLSRRMSAMGPARSHGGPKHDLNLVTIGGSGGSSCMSPRSPHWSMHDKYGAIDDDDDADNEEVAGMRYASPPHHHSQHPQHPPSAASPTADILGTREVAVSVWKGASMSIDRPLEDEAPLRKHRKSSLY
ncbi:hypothetical protein PG996_006838 [Apiospora saccharicola]|uniref:Rhodopsin domain-containing protein n=1 Tax=Apiospora saccharicola TaxID=335842 RepID=A0ABR1V960_9PEZI